MAISATKTFQNLGLATSADKAKTATQQLGQEQFLKLLTTQMTHQDPNKPMDNGNFLAQMAQFSTVEGIGTLNDSFSNFANSLTSGQALQAASLVGQSVLVPGDQGVVSLNKNLSGEIILNDKTSDLKVSFLDSNGVPVKTINLGRQEQGNVSYQWDGVLDDGTYTDPGVYQVRAEGTVNGSNTTLQTYVNADVESVALDKGKKGIQLALAGLGEVNFSEVKKIF